MCNALRSLVPGRPLWRYRTQGEELAADLRERAVRVRLDGHLPDVASLVTRADLHI